MNGGKEGRIEERKGGKEIQRLPCRRRERKWMNGEKEGREGEMNK